MLVPVTDILLTTKIHRPIAASAWILRPGLLAQLDQGLARRLILLSAPPGSGKTALVASWLHRLELSGEHEALRQLDADSPSPRSFRHAQFKSAWLSLGAGDDRLAQFLRYLVAAVRSAVPDACPTTRSLLAAPTLPDVDYFADVLASELAALPVDLVLVLDDYHLITSPEVHALVNHLLHYPPPPLHLVILTRADPPLHLARLRLEQMVTELRLADLRFNLAETGSLLEGRLGRPLAAELVQTLHARTEGWVSGIQLAGIALQREDPRQFLARFHGGEHLLSAYLLEEVLAQLPSDLSEFTLRTALLERFCAPLAETLLEAGDPPGRGQALLDELVRRNLFVVSLDDTDTWYRYHDLFRDFLRAQLLRRGDSALVARVHRCAGAWLAAAGLIDDALRHMLTAGEADTAADLVEQQLYPTLDQQVPHSFLAGWLARFQTASAAAHPGLLIARAWQLGFRWEFAPMAPLIDRIAALLEREQGGAAEQRRLRQANLEFLRGYVAYWQGDPAGARPALERAYALMPEGYPFVQAQVILHLALSTAHTGQAEAARALVRTALVTAEAQRHPTQLLLLTALSAIQLTAADLSAATQAAAHGLAVADTPWARAAWQEVGFAGTWCAWMHYILGAVAYERNELVVAQGHWEQVVAMRYWAAPRTYHEALASLALVARARGEDAVAYAQAARAFAVEAQSTLALAISTALEARLALWAGRRAEARRRAEELVAAGISGTAIGLVLPPLVRLQALLADGAPGAVVAALRLAEAALAQAEGAHNTRQAIAALAHQALALQAARRPAEAIRTLGQALALAEPGGFVRTFLDLGAPLAELLRAYMIAHPHAVYARRLLVAFAAEPGQAPHEPVAGWGATHGGAVTMTPRERELLALIDRRLTTKEIAERLLISPNTVTKHAANIYAKLGVSNRREAAVRARELGLLPSESEELG